MVIWSMVLCDVFSPFNTQKPIYRKLTEYGGLISLSILMVIHFIPEIQQIQDSLSVGVLISSFLSVFGAGRE